MEEKVFRRAAVAAQLKNYVEARLHTDTTDAEKQEFYHSLQEKYADNNRANPYYVILDPGSGIPLSSFEGGTVGSDAPFVRFLQDAWEDFVQSRKEQARVLQELIPGEATITLTRSTANEDGNDLIAEHSADVLPILTEYCFRCHGEKKQKAGIRFDELDPDMIHGGSAEIWDAALDMLNSGEMPPSRADPLPDGERRRLVGWLNRSLLEAARTTAGKNNVVMRRLNRDQYTHSLRDVLGLSMDFGSSLPDDGKSRMGFTNNGEVLLSSPLHLENYQTIAREGLDQAIALGTRPDVTHYRLSFGKGSGTGLPAGTTGGYQAVPLSPDDFVVDILDAEGVPKVGENADDQASLDQLKKKITVGFRGSSQDRFYPVKEGVLLYSGLPHKEVAPGSWQGPSPNMKLEMQRCFPQKGDFVMRVTASRGYIVKEKQEILVSLDKPRARSSITPRKQHETISRQEEEDMLPTEMGAWHRMGPVFTKSGEEARSTAHVDPLKPLDFNQTLADGSLAWEEFAEAAGVIQSYEAKVGAVYLAQIIQSPSKRTMEISLGSDDAVWVWLNGAEVLASDVRRVVAADQERLSLELVPGRNDLLIKIVNYLGQFGSYHQIEHDGTNGGTPPFDLSTQESAMVVRADRTDMRTNIRFDNGSLVPEDATMESSSRLSVNFPTTGYYQFDLVHPVTQPDAMGSIRFSIAAMNLDLRPELTAEQLELDHTVTPLGAGYMDAGPHSIELGGPFFVGFSHLVITPLEEDHPLVQRLEAQAETETVPGIPAIRAFIGTRTDDGMDYKAFDAPREVEAPLGSAETYTFRGRLEDLPIPEPDTGDPEILSGILVLGIWNDHLVKSAKETGPPLLIEQIEFEAPYHAEWPPASHSLIFPEQAEPDESTRTREILSRFLKRAFRRPVTENEVDRYMNFWQEVRGNYEDYERGVQEVLVAALSSPSFLFMIENTEGSAESETLSETALANRLSYFLWNSPPDRELRDLAESNQLKSQLGSQVERLLDDARSERFVRSFTREWLRLDRLEGMTINPNRYPAFTRFVKRDMAEETYSFVNRTLRENMSLFTLIDSDFAMLNQNLAEFYGVGGVSGVHFRAVPITRDQGRGGLLSHGAFLAGHSDGTEPHPIKRAVWIKEKILGDPPLPPPPNVPDLDPETPGFEKLTLKEQIEAHRDNPSCRDCHASFDPFGIAFEGYNAIGLKEPRRKGRPVDTSTVLPDGTQVDGVDDLKTYILNTIPDDFAASLIEHVYAFALGRDSTFADREELQLILNQVKSEDYRFREVIHAIVESPSFNTR